MKLPKRVKVKEVLKGRYTKLEPNTYNSLKRPLDWDGRVEGQEQIKSEDGDTLLLNSTGAQPTPEAGWVVMLRDGDNTKGYSWTLYGIS